MHIKLSCAPLVQASKESFLGTKKLFFSSVCSLGLQIIINENPSPQCKCGSWCCRWRISHTLVFEEGSVPKQSGFSKLSAVWDWYNEPQLWRHWAGFAFQFTETTHSINKGHRLHIQTIMRVWLCWGRLSYFSVSSASKPLTTRLSTNQPWQLVPIWEIEWYRKD